MNASDDSNEGVPLLDERDKGASERKFKIGSSTSSDLEKSSSDSIVFDSNLMKTSTVAGDLLSTWGGRLSHPESSTMGRRRRARSWSAGHPDDVSSEIRILRERLVRTQTRPRPGAVRHLTRRQKLTLFSLALVDFMSFCSMSIMAPFFPREAAQKGLSDTMCGLVFSFYAIVMFLTSPFFGTFLPKVGAKFMFTSGMFMAGVCNVLFGTLVMIEDQTTFTVLCFVVRGLEALGASAFSTASYVFVINAFPDSIGTVLGILETFVGLGMSVGPAIGGLLYSIGGFGLPFYALGVVMVVTVPLNFFLLATDEEYTPGSKSGSILQLFKIPSIIITGLVIVIVSNTWAFLDPTLEPHLRQFDLSTEQIGLIFLLFSGLYGIFSPIWGWVADRVHNHWCMMVWGLFLSTAGLLLLGPCPFIPGLPPDLWLDLVALSILGISVALTLLPTFQGVLTSSIYEGGCPEALATYSAVAGVWSCCYSLGEVLGPALGGALAQRFGFPLTATFCAAATAIMGVITLTFFSLRESTKWLQASDSLSVPFSDSTWTSNWLERATSAPEPLTLKEDSPLLKHHCTCEQMNGGYSNTLFRDLCLLHNKSNKSASANFKEAVAYFLKFQYLTNIFIKLRRRDPPTYPPNTELYQNCLKNDIQRPQRNKIAKTKESIAVKNENKYTQTSQTNSFEENRFVKHLENAIFGAKNFVEDVNEDELMIKRNNKGLVPRLPKQNDGLVEKRPTSEILRHNLEKVFFYEQNPACSSLDNIFVSFKVVVGFKVVKKLTSSNDIVCHFGRSQLARYGHYTLEKTL